VRFIVTKYLFFDLGETLIQYYARGQFQATLPVLFEKMYSLLESDLYAPKEQYWTAMQNENHESPDYSVRTLELRIATIFQISNQTIHTKKLCDLFLSELLAISSIYTDTLPTIKSLSSDFKLWIISNTPWGSPKEYFLQEIKRYGIDRYIEGVTFCRDVGYRKPHRKIFEYALEQLKALPDESVMIGDRYEWDVAGAKQLGMKAILVDREGMDSHDCTKIATLGDLLNMRL
jgi:HAD superfamily hydrolase (TIGR01549 family)